MKAKRTLTLISGILLILLAVGAVVTAIGIFVLKGPVVESLTQIVYDMTMSEAQVLVDAGEMLLTDAIALAEETATIFQNTVGVFFIPAAIGVLFGGVLHAVVGGLLIAHSRKSDEVVATKKAILVIGLIFAILTSNLLVMILLICALAKKVQYEPAFTPPVSETVYPVQPTAEPVVTPVQPVQEEVVTPVQETPAQPEVEQVAPVQNSAPETVDEKIRQLKAMRDSGAITQDEYVELLKKVFNN